MDTVSSLTHGTDRIEYALSSKPPDISALAAAVPGAAFGWCEDGRKLICDLGSFTGGIAAANRAVLPALLAVTDVHSVTPGQSLEDAFLAS
jgi:hypothetical protein